MLMGWNACLRIHREPPFNYRHLDTLSIDARAFEAQIDKMSEDGHTK